MKITTKDSQEETFQSISVGTAFRWRHHEDLWIKVSPKRGIRFTSNGDGKPICLLDDTTNTDPVIVLKIEEIIVSKASQ